MAIKKTAIASAVKKEAAAAKVPVQQVVQPTESPVEKTPITGIWSNPTEDSQAETTTPQKEKEFFKGKFRILHWEIHPNDPTQDIGWVKVALPEEVEYRGPATEATVRRLKSKYKDPQYIVDVDVRYGRYNVCVSEKVILRLRPHVEE